MKLTVADKDRSKDLGGDIAAAAAVLARHPDAPPALTPFHSALILRQATDTSDYLEKLLDLMILKSGGNAGDFYIQRKPGFAGACMAAVRKILWKLLRYQSERIVVQQNAVNAHFSAALQLVRQDYLLEIRRLEERVRELEKPAGKAG